MPQNNKKLEVDLGGLHLKNPIMPASGTFDVTASILTNDELNSLGAVVPKTFTLNKREGNPPPRVYETSAGMVNSVGIPSKGLDYFVEEKLPLLKEANDVIITSIAGSSATQFANLAGKLDKHEEISAIEVNLSCPNLEDDIPFGTNKDRLYNTMSVIRNETDKPLIAKLSPNVTNITEMAFIAENAGTDIITVANTFKGMVIDTETQSPILGNKIGGVSGPGIRPIIVRMIWETAKAVDIPIIGVGGVCNANDAIEMLLAGASAVQIGACNFKNPYVMIEAIEGIGEYLEEKNYDSVEEIIGLVGK